MKNDETQTLIKQILDQMKMLLVAKNEDYGSSVSKTYDKYGMTSFLVRMEDKLNRLETLCRAKEDPRVDESIEDTLLDLLGYACLAVVERRKRGEK